MIWQFCICTKIKLSPTCDVGALLEESSGNSHMSAVPILIRCEISYKGFRVPPEFLFTVKLKLQMENMSPCLANIDPKPQPTPPRNDPGRFLQAYIFPWKILNINIIRI